VLVDRAMAGRDRDGLVPRLVTTNDITDARLPAA
jgi:hypothetical protein